MLIHVFGEIRGLYLWSSKYFGSKLFRVQKQIHVLSLKLKWTNPIHKLGQNVVIVDYKSTSLELQSHICNNFYIAYYIKHNSHTFVN